MTLVSDNKLISSTTTGRSIGVFHTNGMLEKLDSIMNGFPRSQYPNLRMGHIQQALMKIGMDHPDLDNILPEYLEKLAPDKDIAKAASLIGNMTPEQRQILMRQLGAVANEQEDKGDLL